MFSQCKTVVCCDGHLGLSKIMGPFLCILLLGGGGYTPAYVACLVRLVVLKKFDRIPFQFHVKVDIK